MLRIVNLAKRFNRLVILENFNLTVATNGFTVLIGPSGCGKSTLFDLITGVIPRDHGAIFLNQRQVNHLGCQAAYMQQKDLLLPWFSLLENALLPARIAKADLKPAKAKARRLFERMGLQGFEDYYPSKVSGGMRQRCALVRTLMFEYDLVLLDEPLSALDAITRRGLQALLLMLQNDFGKSILMITHDIEEALLLADELIVASSAPMRIRRRLRLNQSKPRRMSDPCLIEIKERVLALLGEDL